MTPEGLYIDPASLKALGINFKRFREHVLRSAHDGLVSFGMQIVAKAKDLLQANDSIASGLLRNSGRTVEQPDGTVDAGFYANYAEFVEYGRKAGGMPPVDDLYQWVKRKHRRSKKNSALTAAAAFTGKNEDQLARSAAWAIATDIKKRGTKAHPFLKPAYEQYRWKINKFMQAQVDKAVAAFKAK
jgi:hypothetical protein